LPDVVSKGQEGPLSIEGRLFCYGWNWLDDLDGMGWNNDPVTGSAGEEGRAGKVLFMIVVVLLILGGLSGEGCGVYFLLAASIVRAARHA
jgi:hypothetical protein